MESGVLCESGSLLDLGRSLLWYSIRIRRERRLFRVSFTFAIITPLSFGPVALLMRSS